MSSRTKWTIWVLIAHDGQQFFEISDFEQSILDQESIRSIRYVLFIYDQSSQKATIKNVKHNNPDQVRFEIAYNISGQDLYNPSTLIDFFRSYRSQYGSTEKNLVITLGHGAGLGYFSHLSDSPFSINFFEGTPWDHEMPSEVKGQYNSDLNVFTFLKANLSLDADAGQILEQIFFKNLSLRDDQLYRVLLKRLELLTASQLNQILTEGFDHVSVEVLITMNCYCQVFECGYELRDSVKLLVSPQTTVPFTGINYGELFKLIERNPDVELKRISEKITSSFHSKYAKEPFRTQFKKRYPKYAKYFLKQVSIAGNFLEYYTEILEIVNELTEKLLPFCQNPQRDPLLANLIVDARKRSLELTPDVSHGMIDLQNYITRLLGNPLLQSDTEFQRVMRRFLILKSFCNASWLPANNEYYSSGLPGSISPLFVSSFFPYGKKGTMLDALTKIYFDRAKPTEFQSKTKWDEMVELVYGTM